MLEAPGGISSPAGWRVRHAVGLYPVGTGVCDAATLGRPAGAAWTKAGVDALEAGAEVVA